MQTTTTPSGLQAPLVHVNGTGKDELIEQYSAAINLIEDAIKALPETHGRDYYPLGNGPFVRAQHQKQYWTEALSRVRGELLEISNHIAGIR